MTKQDITTDRPWQEEMEHWFRRMLSPESPLFKEGTLEKRMDAQFVACNAETKELTLAYHIRNWMQTPDGRLHNGIFTTCFDSVFGTLCDYYGNRHQITTVNLNVSYLAPVFLGETVLLHAKIESLGRQLVRMRGEALVEGRAGYAAMADCAYMILPTLFRA